MKSNLMVKTAKITAKIMARTCLDDDDAEVIKDILRNELRECYNALNEYYDDGYAAGYNDGHSKGYDKGYADGKLRL